MIELHVSMPVCSIYALYGSVSVKSGKAVSVISSEKYISVFAISKNVEKKYITIAGARSPSPTIP